MLAATLPSNQLEHSRGSRKRSTAGVPRCSTAGAVKQKEHSRGCETEKEAQQGLRNRKRSTAGAAKQKEEHSRAAKCVELTGDEVLELNS